VTVIQEFVSANVRADKFAVTGLVPNRVVAVQVVVQALPASVAHQVPQRALHLRVAVPAQAHLRVVVHHQVPVAHLHQRVQVRRAQVQRVQVRQVLARRAQAQQVRVPRAPVPRAPAPQVPVQQAPAPQVPLRRAQVQRVQVRQVLARRAQVQRAPVRRAQVRRAQVAAQALQVVVHLHQRVPAVHPQVSLICVMELFVPTVRNVIRKPVCAQKVDVMKKHKNVVATNV